MIAEIRDGWTILLHPAFKVPFDDLIAEVVALQASAPTTWKTHPKAKLLQRVREIVFEEIPANPDAAGYRLGNTLVVRSQRLCPKRWVNRPTLKQTSGAKLTASFVRFAPLGAAHRHWRRAKFLGRFRLFFRFDSASRLVVIAWVNDENTLRKAGSRNDPYAVILKLLARGDPPNDWPKLLAASRSEPPASAKTRVSHPGRKPTSSKPDP